MDKQLLRRTLCIVAGLLVSGLAVVAAPRALSDTELDSVYAAGFNVQVDFGIDIAATNPDALIVQYGNADAVQNFLDHGMAIANASGTGTRNTGSFDPSGAYMPDLQNLTVNNINITDNALMNSTTLMNVFALEGDIAIGVNLNVVVNPINSTFNINQSNINWGSFTIPSTL
ncbi:MAG: hypothetical protein ACYDBB_18980 [Armatimonadota bacterium]